MKRTIEERLLNPRPGSKIAAAKEFGIDLTLLLANLKLTPEQRVNNMVKSMRGYHRILTEAHERRKERRGGIGHSDNGVGGEQR